MGWIGDHAWQAWLIAAGVLAVLELVSLDLVFIMLAGGALVGAVASAVGAPGALSVGLALVTAVGLLALIRPGVVKSLHAGPDLRTGTAALVGSRAVVLSAMGAHSPGRVKIGGEEWAALPYDEDDRIEAGETVDVVQIKGATAYVLRTHAIGNG
jgi:membrane protein implicated in regulation of membrane protease activity